jgi:hypothetical protein
MWRLQAAKVSQILRSVMARETYEVLDGLMASNSAEYQLFANSAGGKWMPSGELLTLSRPLIFDFSNRRGLRCLSHRSAPKRQVKERHPHVPRA